MFDIPCVILSGGKSSRMKQDKSLMKFGEYKSLIEYQYHKMKNIFSLVYISAKSNKFSNFISKENLIIEDSDIYSPMIALQEIFTKLNGKIFIITVDIPLITKQTIKTIIKNSNNYKITLAQSNNRIHSLCGVYDTTILTKVNESLKNDIHKIRYLNKTIKSNIINFDDYEFLNVNNKEDYNKAIINYLVPQHSTKQAIT
jgi:molybdopterin-guanine dinucleotide biosynthesis protein A